MLYTTGYHDFKNTIILQEVIPFVSYDKNTSRYNASKLIDFLKGCVKRIQENAESFIQPYAQFRDYFDQHFKISFSDLADMI